MRVLISVALLALLAGCSLTPPAYSGDSKVAVEKTVAAFQKDKRLAPFFEQAVAYVVFPHAVRAGTGFGGAWGGGWLLEGDRALGRVALKEGFVGANLGAQYYRQIIFFKTEQSLERFKRGGFEFTGQASVAATLIGKNFTPAFNTEVAVFAKVRGGLWLEASVGTQHYRFYPL